MTSEELARRIDRIEEQGRDARRVANQSGGDVDQRSVVDALNALTGAVLLVAELLLPHPDEFVYAGCTSDDPTNHQGETCPVHEVAS